MVNDMNITKLRVAQKTLWLVVAFILLTGGTAMADITEHPFYGKLMTITNSFVNAIAAKQDEYFIANGRYFQGIRIPEGELDGTTDVSVNVNAKPHDQEETWAQFDKTLFKNNLKVPYNISIDVYEAPSGWGWILTGELWYDGLGPDSYGNNGSHWVFKHHEGPMNLGFEILDEWYIKPDIFE